MGSIITSLIATIITVPLIGLITIYIISIKITKNKKKSFHYTVDYSTILFVFSVYTLTYVIWEKSFLWYMIILLAFIAMGLVFLQWKFNEEIKFKKVWKGFLRVNFLLFFISYFGLVFFGLIQRMISL